MSRACRYSALAVPYDTHAAAPGARPLSDPGGDLGTDDTVRAHHAAVSRDP